MGQITDHVIAYRAGQMSFENPCSFLANFPYRACAPLGWWQMWAGPGALDDSIQEVRIPAGNLLNEDEYVAVIGLSKSISTLGVVLATM
jgi:hypothetical protein